MRTQDIKARAEELEDDYEPAMISNLIEDLDNELTGMSIDDINADILEDIVANWYYNMPSISDWCFDQIDIELNTVADQKYQEYKDMQ